MVSIFTAVPTSDRTEVLARDLGIPLVTLDEIDRLDLGIDGADEIDPALDAIKGRGGALLREKLVALSCDDYVLVATTEKSVDQLGTRTPLPVEIVAFGWSQTAKRLASMGISPELRTLDGDPTRPWVTDNGGLIMDCATGPIADPSQLAAAVKAAPGVVEHGLFLGIARAALQVDPDGQVVRREPDWTAIREPVGDRETFRKQRAASRRSGVSNCPKCSHDVSPALAEIMLSFASVECRARAFR